ncbi:MAG TPA: hypothetical protein VD947_03675 [Patescibacteria group bacterium]|nr:hypothetical protein [Patescibacteria group bacterium]
MSINNNQKGFGALEALLTVLVVGLLGLAGYLVYSRQQDQKDREQLQEQISELKTEESSTDEEKQKATPRSEDEEILATAGCENGTSQEGDKCIISEKQGNLALVTIGGDFGGVNIFLAKANSGWDIIFQGQGEVPQETVTKYNIPESWLGPSI